MAKYIENEYIKYDLDNHYQYITDKYYQSEYGSSISEFINFTHDNDIERFFKRISRVLINECTRSREDDQIEILKYKLATEDKFRKGLTDAALEVAYSIAESGFDATSQTGMDYQKQMNFKEIDIAMFSPNVRNIMSSSGIAWRGDYSTVDYDIDKIEAEKELGDW